MLQKLEDHIKACSKRASDAERRAAEVADPDLKADYLALAAQWIHLARSYEFSESSERFPPLDLQRSKDGAATAAAGNRIDRLNCASPNGR